MPKFRYYEAKAATKPSAAPKAVYTNFLRTGRIVRKEDWVETERRFLTEDEVAKRTGLRLENAGRKTHQRLNSFHDQIRFPKIIFHKTLKDAPHLGYVHVTASTTDFDGYTDVTWGFYMANFSARVSADEPFFNRVDPGYSKMYFAVAMKTDEDGDSQRLVIDRSFRENGVLFKTSDPKTALKNVLMLGAKSAELRKIVEAIG